MTRRFCDLAMDVGAMPPPETARSAIKRALWRGNGVPQSEAEVAEITKLPEPLVEGIIRSMVKANEVRQSPDGKWLPYSKVKKTQRWR